MADVQGKCDERFAGVRDVLATNLDAGKDVGASVAVMLDDKLVVDICGGFSDQRRPRPRVAPPRRAGAPPPARPPRQGQGGRVPPPRPGPTARLVGLGGADDRSRL